MFIKELIYNLLALGPETIAKFPFWLLMPLKEKRCQYLIIRILKCLVECHCLRVF